jgi:hypothetical protein
MVSRTTTPTTVEVGPTAAAPMHETSSTNASAEANQGWNSATGQLLPPAVYADTCPAALLPLIATDKARGAGCPEIKPLRQRRRELKASLNESRGQPNRVVRTSSRKNVNLQGQRTSRRLRRRWHDVRRTCGTSSTLPAGRSARSQRASGAGTRTARPVLSRYHFGKTLESGPLGGTGGTQRPSRTR